LGVGVGMVTVRKGEIVHQSRGKGRRATGSVT